MKSKILITIVFFSLVLSGCSTVSPKEPEKQTDIKKEQKTSFATQINQSLKNNFTITETDNPNLTLPSDINAGQIKKYFKMDNILFALVLTQMPLPLPSDFTPSFAGVLVAKQGDTQWTKLLEIKDSGTTDATNSLSFNNNPYYLMVDNKQLLLTVVDQNGAGSGEGIMKVFALSETNEWTLDGCYYFGLNFNDPEIDGDYYAFSTKFSKQTTEPKATCVNDVQLITNE
jgi:hypothetical protein